MSDIQEFPKLAEVDPNYAENRARLDKKNQEQNSKLNSENDEEDAFGSSGRNIVKPGKTSAPIKLSDFRDLRYRMSRQHMGYFLIFNQEKFKTSHPFYKRPRAGSSVDAEKLEESMKKLGFTVYRYDNRTTSEIMSYLKQYVCSPSNKDVNAFGCAFFSHGEENGEMATFDDFISVKELIEQTHHGRDLIGKPRLFFFQACRGGYYMDGTKFKAVALGDNKTLSWPKEADILCHFATTEGHLSFRNPTHGSWFIRNLTEVLNKYALSHEFHHVLLRVNAGIAELESQTGQANTSGKKQASQIQSQLTKELWFGDFKNNKE